MRFYKFVPSRILFAKERGKVWSVALSADGQLPASRDTDGAVQLWNVASGTRRALLQGHINVVWSVALSLNGRVLTSGGADGMIQLWRLPDATPWHTLHADRLDERMDISGLARITPAQRAAFMALGAIDHRLSSLYEKIFWFKNYLLEQPDQ